MKASAWITAASVIALTIARLLYLAFWCPYSLVEDEAFYWEWSRHLEWSYYSKGPGIAWTIAVSQWLGSMTGTLHHEFWVRAAAPLFGAVTLASVAVLARRVFGESRVALAAMLAVLCAPGVQWLSLLMTIDGPLLACWSVAALMAYSALCRASRAAWIGLGAAVGIGFMFKYTQVLLVPGIVLFAFLGRTSLRLAPDWKRWGLGALLMLVACCSPVIIYNARHDWVTVKHLIGHLGLVGGDVAPPPGRGVGFSPIGALQLLGAQLGLIGPMLIVLVWSAVRIRRHGAVQVSGVLFLGCCAAPVLLFYLLISFIASPEGNWPLAGYVTLFPLIGWGGVTLWRLPRPKLAPIRAAWSGTLIVGGIVGVLSLRLDLISHGLLARGLRDVLAKQGWVAADRPLIPLGRLMGADAIAKSAHRAALRVEQETGRPPLFIAQHYGRTAQMAFYLPGQPIVYCSSAKSEGRRTQYDLWQQTSLDDRSLPGRDALLIGGHPEQWEPAFERIVELGPLEGETKKDRKSYVGYGFRGFPPSASP